MKILGIDPGLNGGLVLMDNGCIVQMSPMPMQIFTQKKTRKIKKTEANPNNKKTKTYVAQVKQIDFVKLNHIFNEFLEYGIDIVYLEKVSARPDEGVSSTFKFGICYGALLAILVCKDLQHALVTPNVWAKQVCSGAPQSMEPKDRSRVIAGRLFPRTSFVLTGCRKEHSGLIDAALIAYYGNWKETNGV